MPHAPRVPSGRVPAKQALRQSTSPMNRPQAMPVTPTQPDHADLTPCIAASLPALLPPHPPYCSLPPLSPLSPLIFAPSVAFTPSCLRCSAPPLGRRTRVRTPRFGPTLRWASTPHYFLASGSPYASSVASATWAAASGVAAPALRGGSVVGRLWSVGVFVCSGRAPVVALSWPLGKLVPPAVRQLAAWLRFWPCRAGGFSCFCLVFFRGFCSFWPCVLGYIRL